MTPPTSSAAADALAEALREGVADEFAPASRPSAAPKLADPRPSRSTNEQNGIRLHGQITPSYEVVTERPEHLVMAYMAATGMSQVEIAQRTGRNKRTISNLFRQEWFVKRVTDIITEQGRDAVTELIAGAAEDSVVKIINLRDWAKDERVQFHSAVEILNRHLGKSSQPLKIDDGRLLDPVAEAARLDREIGAVEAAERNLNVRDELSTTE